MKSVLKAALRKDFSSFVHKAFLETQGKKLEDPYIAHLCFRIEQFAAGKTRRQVINLPPRHLKTQVGSVYLTAFILGLDPTAEIMIVTYGEDLARDIAHDIRAIMQAAWYLEVFDTRLDTTRVMDFKTKKGGGVFAVPIGGGITGHGADYIIIDDPIEIKDADNLEQLEWVNDRFDTTIRSRLNDAATGRILIVAHRLNEIDLSGHVLKEGDWDHVVLPFIATRTKTYKLGHGSWRRKKDETLRPWPKAEVKRVRATRNFQALYQQDPSGAALPRIEADDFPKLDIQTVAPGLVVLSVDPGEQNGERNSYSVIQAWRVAQEAYLLQDQWRGRAEYSKVRSACKDFIRKYRPSALLIERNGFGAALLSDITPKSWMEIVPVVPRASKIDRLRDHVDEIRAGKILLLRHQPWIHDYIEEFVDFPGSRFTDQIDATTQFLQYMAGEPSLPMPPMRATGAVSLSNGARPAPISPKDPRLLQGRHGVALLGRRRW